LYNVVNARKPRTRTQAMSKEKRSSLEPRDAERKPS
jgi:hypothetical protein